MKLAKIYKRYTLLTLALVLLVGSLSHYVIITYFVHRSADHTLREYRQNIADFVAEQDTLMILDNPLLNTSRLSGVEIGHDFLLKEHFRDTLVYSNYKEEAVVFRLLSYNLHVKDKNYLITLWQATVDTEDILAAVIVSLIILFVLFTFFSLWWTKWFVGKLWYPFYQMLEQLREVDLINLHEIKIPRCRVDEFNMLHRVLHRMLDRIQGDYISLRELTETTAHELQTPLSVVKARLELLQQSGRHSEQDTELIRSVNNAVDRVIRLNRFMLMIAKINNDQFPAESPLVLNDFLDDFLGLYEDMIEIRGLTVKKDYSSQLVLSLHPQLAEMLASNLLSNAIRYNVKDGYIRIETTARSFQICNSYGNVIPTGDLFTRFTKSGQDKEASGLGLAIVKSICQKNNLEISVSIQPEQFCIRISLNNHINSDL